MSGKIKFSPKEFYGSHPIICHLLFIVLVGLLLLWGVLIFLDSWTMHGSTSVVPQIKHRSYSEAAAALMANNLGIEISDSIYEPSYAPGTVIESWPKAGAIVKAGRQVYVTVTAFSAKKVTISMPLTGNVSKRQAESYLRGIGIKKIRIEEVPSDYPDLVVSATYNGKPLTVGSVIPVTSTVVLSVGTGPVAPANDSEESEESLADVEG